MEPIANGILFASHLFEVSIDVFCPLKRNVLKACSLNLGLREFYMIFEISEKPPCASFHSLPDNQMRVLIPLLTDTIDPSKLYESLSSFIRSDKVNLNYSLLTQYESTELLLFEILTTQRDSYD